MNIRVFACVFVCVCVCVCVCVIAVPQLPVPAVSPGEHHSAQGGSKLAALKGVSLV